MALRTWSELYRSSMANASGGVSSMQQNNCLYSGVVQGEGICGLGSQSCICRSFAWPLRRPGDQGGQSRFVVEQLSSSESAITYGNQPGHCVNGDYFPLREVLDLPEEPRTYFCFFSAGLRI